MAKNPEENSTEKLEETLEKLEQEEEEKQKELAELLEKLEKEEELNESLYEKEKGVEGYSKEVEPDLQGVAQKQKELAGLLKEAELYLNGVKPNKQSTLSKQESTPSADKQDPLKATPAQQDTRQNPFEKVLKAKQEATKVEKASILEKLENLQEEQSKKTESKEARRLGLREKAKKEMAAQENPNKTSKISESKKRQIEALLRRARLQSKEQGINPQVLKQAKDILATTGDKISNSEQSSMKKSLKQSATKDTTKNEKGAGGRGE